MNNDSTKKRTQFSNIYPFFLKTHLIGIFGDNSKKNNIFSYSSIYFFLKISDLAEILKKSWSDFYY